MEYKYFTDDEFKRATPSCSLSDMDEKFMSKLDAARELAGVPFIVSSAYRSVAYEKKKGRSGTSRHTMGIAMDIRCYDNALRFRIVFALLSVGFRRIGIASSYIHVDDGYLNSTPLIWLYR